MADSSGHKPPETTRRAEVETARRTSPVQVFRAQVKALGDNEALIKAMAEAMRGLLRRK